MRLRTASTHWNVPGKYGPHGELFFFLIKKEPLALTEAAQFKPFVPAETLKACALIGVYLMGAEGASGSSGSPSPDLGDMWRHGCRKSPDWDSEGGSWSEREGLSSSYFREHDVESPALHVIGLHWSGEKVSFFLEDWELARVALSCHIALDMFCQEVHEVWLVAGLLLPERPPCRSMEAFLSPWTGCDNKGEGGGGRKIKERRKGILLFRIFVVV